MDQKAISSPDLSDRLAALKEKHNTSIVSEDRSPFPLWALLILYERAYPACYTDYMLGLKLLVDWLGPIELSLVNCDINIPNYPELLSNYEIQKIAELLNVDENLIIHTLIHKGYYTYDY